jgi:DNA-binding LacI/PurR family transcriptional regulator
MAIGALKGLREAGLRDSQDVALVGFGEEEPLFIGLSCLQS